LEESDNPHEDSNIACNSELQDEVKDEDIRVRDDVENSPNSKTSYLQNSEMSVFQHEIIGTDDTCKQLESTRGSFVSYDSKSSL